MARPAAALLHAECHGKRATLPDPEADPSAAELIAARPWLTRHAMDGLLLDGVPLLAIAADHGTPCWVMSAATLRGRLRRLRAAMPGIAIHYAVKANDALAVLALLGAEGAGADVVSAGEFCRARAAGIPAARMVFSGVGKTRAELEMALAAGIGQINVESPEELAMLAGTAAAMGRQAPVALRVNPDVDAGTHEKIATGRAGDKFGIAVSDVAPLYAHAATLPCIALRGLAVHIGSQITTMAPFRAAYARIADLVRALRTLGLPVPGVDCGGGLAIAYRDEAAPLPEAWAAVIGAELGGLDLQLSIEPGRWLAGPAGLLLASVIRTRRAGMPTPCVILDAAMNDLVRPAMYGAWHGIVPAAAADLIRPEAIADIAGPVCESGDVFARTRSLAPLDAGAIVAILDTGAYGSVMSSTYNARPLAPVVLVDKGVATRIRPRQTLEQLWAEERLPG